MGFKITKKNTHQSNPFTVKSSGDSIKLYATDLMDVTTVRQTHRSSAMLTSPHQHRLKENVNIKNKIYQEVTKNKNKLSQIFTLNLV